MQNELTVSTASEYSGEGGVAEMCGLVGSCQCLVCNGTEGFGRIGGLTGGDVVEDVFQVDFG